MNYLEEFSYQFYGKEDENKKLVLLHGLMGYAKNWASVAKQLSLDFHVLCYDQRGHGKSCKPSSGYAPEDYAEDLKAIIDQLNWQQIYLVGHSMGARNALQFSYLYPERVHKLVMEDIGPNTSVQAVDNIHGILDRVKVPFASRELAKQHIMANFSDNLVLANYLYANMEKKVDASVDWQFSRPAILESVQKGRERERWKEWQALELPSLVIRGEHSEELPREVYQRMLTSNSRAQGIEIADARHWVHYDQRQRFIEVVREFLLN